ncbi:MAG: hypothetical protein SOW78_03735 [Clostridia bacterium]|nr:hypothetical protein [Clostridia bacterium]
MVFLLVFIMGAFGYGALEIIWRGFTHWTMMLVGGICFSLIYTFYCLNFEINIIWKCVIAASLITAVELVSGYILNIKLKMDIWDYSYLPLNFHGQICLPYSVLWFALSSILFKLCEFIGPF